MLHETVVMEPFTDLTPFIMRDGEQLITDSRAVAVAFKKRHKNVMRTINGMRDSNIPEIAEHHRLNFEPVDFLDSKGERRPMYRMTDEGLSELAMSFSGDAARVVRIRFINAFKEVAARLERTEKSIIARLLELERREMPSQLKGKVGSRMMNERRKEKTEFEEERCTLLALVQPTLPLGNLACARVASDTTAALGVQP